MFNDVEQQTAAAVICVFISNVNSVKVKYFETQKVLTFVIFILRSIFEPTFTLKRFYPKRLTREIQGTKAGYLTTTLSSH